MRCYNGPDMTTLQDPKTTVARPKSWTRTLGYFFLGLFFNYLGLIIGFLWIKFRTKTEHKAKAIALVTGFSIFALFSYIITPFIITPRAERALFERYPELQIVRSDLQNRYPKTEIGVSANTTTSWHKSFGSEETKKTTTNIFTVQLKSKETLNQSQVNDIGKLVCNDLSSVENKYDIVSIVTIQSLLPFDIPFVHVTSSDRTSLSCDDWLKK